MFKSLGLFSKLPCPVRWCKLPGCLFLHPEPPQEARAVKRCKLESSEPHGEVLRAERARIAMQEATDQELAAESKVAASDIQQEASLTAIPGSVQQDVLSAAVSKAEMPTSVVLKPSDQRYISRATTTTEISIRFEPSCKIAHESRLHYLRLYKKQFDRIYAAFDDDLYKKLTHDHAVAQERQIMLANGKGTYKQASKNALIGLTKRELAIDENDIGLHPSYKPPIRKLAQWSTLVHSVETLTKWGYTTDIPIPDSDQADEENCDRICDRCSQRFIVTSDPSRWLSCTYHPGKSTYKIDKGERITSWTCCNSSSTSKVTGDSAVVGCSTCPTHVFKIDHAPRLAAYNRYQMLPLLDSQDPNAPSIEIAALDCEMVYTTASLELARVSVTLPSGSPALDLHVKPDRPILDYNTRYSGITAASLAADISSIPMSRLVEKLLAVGITRDTILVGHGLENDLTAMRLVHHKVIDSAILFPHPRGRPYRNGLKYLAKRYLKKDIQNPAPVINLHERSSDTRETATSTGLVLQGHDSLEDARAAMELVQWKMNHGDEKVGDTPFPGKLK